MGAGYREKGWEFWLGSGFVAAAALIIAPAFWLPDWRIIVGSVGAAVAAFAVVGASLIAYSGAIAKVRFDRQLETERGAARSRRLFLRTHMAAALLYEEASAASRQFVTILRDRRIVSPPTLVPAEFAISEPSALIEAWNELDSLPPDCVPFLRSIRLRLARIERLWARYGGTHHLRAGQADGALDEIAQELDAIVNDTKRILEILQPVVIKYAPPPSTPAGPKAGNGRT